MVSGVLTVDVWQGAAVQWAKAGAAAIVLASRGLDDLEATRKALEATNPGRNVLAVPTDVSSHADVKRLFDATLQQFGRVHVVVHSAGVLGPVANIGDSAVEEWWKAFVRPTLQLRCTFRLANKLACAS